MSKLFREWYYARGNAERTFVTKCGFDQVLKLCEVDVYPDVCNYLGFMWSKTQRVMRIKDVQLCPVLEEFLYLFGDKSERGTIDSMVVPLYKSAWISDVACFLKISREKVQQLVVGRRLSVELICTNLRYHRSETVRGKAFLLAFTGCYLLSDVDGLFSMDIVHFLQHCILGGSIVPIVLGHLLYCLDNYCEYNVLLGCPLLYAIWALEHLRGTYAYTGHYVNPIENFIARDRHLDANGLDYLMFKLVSIDNIRWKVNFWHFRHRFFATNGSRCCVVLPTLVGTTFYIPAVVLRQYGFKQDVPQIEGPYPTCKRLWDMKVGATKVLRLALSEPMCRMFPENLEPSGDGINYTEGYIDWIKRKETFIEESDSDMDEDSEVSENGEDMDEDID